MDMSANWPRAGIAFGVMVVLLFVTLLLERHQARKRGEQPTWNLRSVCVAIAICALAIWAIAAASDLAGVTPGPTRGPGW